MQCIKGLGVQAGLSRSGSTIFFMTLRSNGYDCRMDTRRHGKTRVPSINLTRGFRGHDQYLGTLITVEPSVQCTRLGGKSYWCQRALQDGSSSVGPGQDLKKAQFIHTLEKIQVVELWGDVDSLTPKTCSKQSSKIPQRKIFRNSQKNSKTCVP